MAHWSMYTWCRCFLTSVSENPCELQILVQKSSFPCSKSHQIYQGKNAVRSENTMSVMNKITCFSLTRLRQPWQHVTTLVIKGETKSFVVVIHEKSGGGGKVIISSWLRVDLLFTYSHSSRDVWDYNPFSHLVWLRVSLLVPNVYLDPLSLFEMGILLGSLFCEEIKPSFLISISIISVHLKYCQRYLRLRHKLLMCF